MKQQTGEGQEVEVDDGSREPRVIARQTAATRHPDKGAFHHPAPGQQHDAALGLLQFDHLQPDAVCRRVRFDLLPVVALVAVVRLLTLPDPGRTPAPARGPASRNAACRR